MTQTLLVTMLMKFAYVNVFTFQSQQIAWSAYSASLFDTSRRAITNIHIFIQRSKKPLLISMGSIFPDLSLQYYVNVRYFIFLHIFLHALNRFYD